MKTQTEQILELLWFRGEAGLTAYDALGLVSCFRLAARIADLRGEGHDITSTMETLPNGKRVARYRLREHWVTSGEQTAMAL
jgi:hypothetical protein